MCMSPKQVTKAQVAPKFVNVRMNQPEYGTYQTFSGQSVTTTVITDHYGTKIDINTGKPLY